MKLTAEKCAWLIRQLKSAEVMSGELSIADQYKLQALEIALPVLEQEGGWISCSERMPEDDTLCLGFDSDEIIWTAHFDGGFLTPDCGADDLIFTHWMPLPAPPTPQTSTNPQIENDGWIGWCGGDKPVSYEAKVNVKFRDGDTGLSHAHFYRWKHIGSHRDIIAYRVIENDGREG